MDVLDELASTWSLFAVDLVWPSLAEELELGPVSRVTKALTLTHIEVLLVGV